MSEIRFWRAVFSLLGLGAVIAFVFVTWQVFVPFLLGLVIAYLVHPLVDRLVALGWRQDRTVIVLYVVLLIMAVALCIWLIPSLFQQAEEALQTVRNYTATVNNLVEQLTIKIREILKHVIGKRAQSFVIPFRADMFVEHLFARLPANLLNVAHFGMWVFIIPFVSFFALTQGKQWIDLLFEWTPSEYVEGLLGLFAEINATLGGYVRGQLLDAIAVGFLTMIGLLALGVNGAVLLGFLTGLFNVVPYMAPVVGGGLALLTAFFQGSSHSVLIGIFILYGVVRIIDDFVFMPFIIGHNVSLHPVVMIFAILAGVHVGGFLGLVFAIPTGAVIKVILTILLQNKRAANFGGEKHVV